MPMCTSRELEFSSSKQKEAGTAGGEEISSKRAAVIARSGNGFNCGVELDCEIEQDAQRCGVVEAKASDVDGGRAQCHDPGSEEEPVRLAWLAVTRRSGEVDARRSEGRLVKVD